MALLFCDSFDHYASADLTDKWTAYNHNALGGEITIDSGTGRTSNALKYTITDAASYPNALYITPRIAPTGATAILGFAIKVTNVAGIANSSNGAWFTPYYGSTDHMRVSLASSGLWQLRLDAGYTSPIATSAGMPITSGVWYYVEIKWVIGASGTVTIRVNGTQTLAYSGDTMNGTTAGWSGMGVFGLLSYPSSAASGHGGVYVDDLVLMDGSGSLNNNFIGDVTVAAHFPNANGATSGWTRSTGADDYAVIDETTPNDDTDYLSTETLDAVTTVGVANAPAGAEVLGVQVNAQVKRSGVGSPAIAAVVRHSGTDYPTTAVGVATTGYLNLQFPYDANPGTGVAWTESGFNDAEFGVKKTA